MQTLGIINNILPFSHKKKERFQIILEPLQALFQLSLLSFTPIDTKLNIYNNILYIQIPNWHQSISRTYYNDSKDDLFYLFNVIRRFKSFYINFKDSQNQLEKDLYNLLVNLACIGIDNLLLTYQNVDKTALLHTLHMYKSMLDNSNTHLNFDDDNNRIDTIFINIKDLYTQPEISILYNTLLIIQRDPTNYLNYINGINMMLIPMNEKIRKWINDKIVF